MAVCYICFTCVELYSQKQLMMSNKKKKELIKQDKSHFSAAERGREVMRLEMGGRVVTGNDCSTWGLVINCL